MSLGTGSLGTVTLGTTFLATLGTTARSGPRRSGRRPIRDQYYKYLIQISIMSISREIKQALALFCFVYFRAKLSWLNTES